MADDVHPVDQFLPVPKLLTLGLQHVLVMYAGAVAVPLILGRALKLPPEDVAFLISADLFTCGLATLVQCIGFPGVGIRLPVMMGVTFASVGPMLSMAAVARRGFAWHLWFGHRRRRLCGTGRPFHGEALAAVPAGGDRHDHSSDRRFVDAGGNQLGGGGLPTLTKIVDGAKGAFPNPSFGQLEGLGVALFVLLVILALLRFFKGFVSNVAVLLGIVAGAVLASLLGVMHFDKVVSAPWVDVVAPLRFGLPKFQLVPIVTMCIVMIVVMIELTGMFLALGEMTGRRIDQAAITRGLRADGVGTILGGIFNTFPYTSFSQNVGLVGVTGVRSRWVTATGGLIMVALGLLPKMSALVEAVPVVVLGGAGIVMFGMVAATGARILTGVDFKTNRYNLFVVAIAVGFGMIPLVAPNFFQYTPEVLRPLLELGILLAAIVSVLLNLFFNGLTKTEAAFEEAAAAAGASEHA